MQQYSMSPLMGHMMSQPLLISNLSKHADRYYPHTEIVSRRVEGDIHRYTYRDCHRRSRQLANALKNLGVKSCKFTPYFHVSVCIGVGIEQGRIDIPISIQKQAAMSFYYRCIIFKQGNILFTWNVLE